MLGSVMSVKFRSFLIATGFFVLLAVAAYQLNSRYYNSVSGGLSLYTQQFMTSLASKSDVIKTGNLDRLKPILMSMTKDPMISSVKLVNFTGAEASHAISSDNLYEYHTQIKNSGKVVADVYIGFNESMIERRFGSQSGSTTWAVMVVGGYLLSIFLLFFFSSNASARFDAVLGSLKRFLRTSRKHSSQLRSFAKDILDGASEQSTSSQEIVSTMSEMRAMIRQTSEKIDEGKKTANDIRQSSEVGKGIMHEMHNGMEEINRAAIQLDEINEVISEIKGQTEIINEIVSKTQLLSFNASIEAARAGQYGKGFAVVAQEVSKLAEMSGMASKDISGLLGKSSEKVTAIVKEVEQRVKEGTEISTRSMSMFEEISENISRLVENVENFTEANKEQEKGIAEVSVALDTLKEAIDKQQTRTNEVEQISKRSDAQSAAIYKLINNFNISENESTSKSKSEVGKKKRSGSFDMGESLPENVESIASAKDRLLAKNKGTEGAEIVDDESNDVYKDFK